MRHTVINHPRLCMSIRTGSEGPRHDPYSYTETTIQTDGGEVLIHEGLGEYVKVDGKMVELPSWLNGLNWDTKEMVERLWREHIVEQITGYSRKQLDRIQRRLESHCKRCGGKRFHCEEGYPGESFTVCDTCNNVNNTYFYLSAVE